MTESAWDPRAQIVMVAGYCDIHPMDICLRIPPADRLFFVQKPFHALEVKQLVHALGAKWKGDGASVGVRRAPAAPQAASARTMLVAVQHYPIGAMVFDNRDSLLAANPEFVRLFPELADVLAAGMTYDEVCRLMAERHGEEDVTVITQDAVVSTFAAILNTLTIVLAATFLPAQRATTVDLVEALRAE